MAGDPEYHKKVNYSSYGDTKTNSKILQIDVPKKEVDKMTRGEVMKQPRARASTAALVKEGRRASTCKEYEMMEMRTGTLYSVVEGRIANIGISLDIFEFSHFRRHQT